MLTGGACATLYSRGAYTSLDADFILGGSPARSDVDRAMASVGFARRGDRYTHPRVPYFVEFPRGPLGIGGDFAIKPVLKSRRGAKTLALSATDSCRDRLAAFYHWPDRQSLSVAVAIARRRSVAFQKIRRWSALERRLDKYEEFLAEIRRSRRRGRGRDSSKRL